MRDKIRAELLILDGEVLARDVGHEEVSDQHTHDADDGSHDEGPSFAEVILYWRERLDPNCRPCLAHSGGDAVAGPADGGGVGFRGEETEHVPWAHISRGEHQAVENDEEGDDFGDLVVGYADYKAEDH